MQKLRMFVVYLGGPLGAMATLFLLSCVSSKTNQRLEVPLNMPNVCQGIDFNLNVEMREVCGVKVRSFRAYKNIAEYRLLLKPKGAKIVKKGSKVELRLPKTLPIELPRDISKNIDFNETLRNKFLKSTWEYHEFFPKGSKTRIKIMKFIIPLNNRKVSPVCYSIVPKIETPAPVQKGFSTSLESLSCEKFDKLVTKITGE